MLGRGVADAIATGGVAGLVAPEVSAITRGADACSAHPVDFAARTETPGIAHADLRRDPLPSWLGATLGGIEADVVIVSPHWGPNMTTEPLPYVRRSAAAMLDAGATLVAGH